MQQPRAPAGRSVQGGQVATALRPERPVTERVRLARVALDSALSVDGVVASHPGAQGLGAVNDAGALLRGVTAAAVPEGRYELGLHLVASPVPLPALADRVRDRVGRAADRVGLADRLGPINVAFEDLLDPAEPLPPPSP